MPPSSTLKSLLTICVLAVWVSSIVGKNEQTASFPSQIGGVRWTIQKRNAYLGETRSSFKSRAELCRVGDPDEVSGAVGSWKRLGLSTSWGLMWPSGRDCGLSRPIQPYRVWVSWYLDSQGCLAIGSINYDSWWFSFLNYFWNFFF